MQKIYFSSIIIFLLSFSSIANAGSYSCSVKYINWKNGDSQTTTYGHTSVKASSNSDARYKAMSKMADLKGLPMSRMISAKCSGF